MFTLWCGLGGLAYYPVRGRSGQTERFLDRCLAAGATSLRFYFGFVHHGDPTVFRLERGERPFVPDEGLVTFELYARAPGWDPFAALVEGAHARGIQVWGYSSANYQGAQQPNPHSPQGERLPLLFLSEFSNWHPEYWARDAQGRDSLEREGYVVLSLAFDPVREHLSDTLAALAEEVSLEGLELEWLCGREAATPYGLEGAAGSVSRFVRQVRQKLAPGLGLSAAVVDDSARALAWGYDWPVWVDQRSVQTIVLRHSGGPAQISTRVQEARARCGEAVHLVSQLNCWHEVGLRDGKSLVQAAEAALSAGADEVGIYRADAVEASGLWPALSQVAALNPE